MTIQGTPIEEIEGLAPDTIPYDDLIARGAPVVLKGVVQHWPMVREGLTSAQAAADYLKSFDGGRQVTGYVGDPAMKGRFFYNDDMTGPNYTALTDSLGAFLDRILAEQGAGAQHCYMGSTDADMFLPGLRAENDLPLDHDMFRRGQLLVSAWIGNRTTAAAHYDMSNNLACTLVGKRRFTLFPPEEVHNLYPGPLEPTPGGQVVSMVDFSAPDYERYPNFRTAEKAALVAEVGPGDVVFFPALWWHQVEALSEFNVMLNYWWNDVPAFTDNPRDTLMHAMLSLRDRPEHEKAAWKHLFDYYVFGPPGTAGNHLPDHARGPLGPLDDAGARRLRAQLLRRLNR